ncbi:hypothetical protein SD70_29565 [Gordoniibacillus kamchatkensis]|uniref:UPF0340 protein SD70_29565 n=1 Tax=Gordoniibacillus kamchatkensis TaxID=1590651 RepID=A0ABR5AAA1_9BACL|nr:hypothetical protein SD70_29565 [Paenibacillus sp. VKM B-2647]
MDRIENDAAALLRELAVIGNLKRGHIVVFGTSTSEVMGARIGTAGATDVAERLFRGWMGAAGELGLYVAFQCCEHLNRALVVSEELLEAYPQFERVSVVPVPKAGGAMASYAYRHLANPCVIETVAAHAGIDVGDTLIGMHLRRVAVPARLAVRSLGHAHVTAAYTRPKLIGGARAVYELEPSGHDKPASDTSHCT